MAAGAMRALPPAAPADGGEGLDSLEAAAAEPEPRRTTGAGAGAPAASWAAPPPAGDHVEALSGLPLRDRVASGAAVEAFVGSLRFVPLRALVTGQGAAFAAASTRVAGSSTAGPRDGAATLATVAVLASRTARGGGDEGDGDARRFVKWQMTDFATNLPVTVLLFGAAAVAAQHEPVGSVWALRELRLLPDRRADDRAGAARTSDQAAYSVSLPTQLLKVGRSPELAFCEATRHSGQPCGLPVRSAMRFCAYHLQQSRSQLLREFAGLRGDMSGHTSESRPRRPDPLSPDATFACWCARAHTQAHGRWCLLVLGASQPLRPPLSRRPPPPC